MPSSREAPERRSTAAAALAADAVGASGDPVAVAVAGIGVLQHGRLGHGFQQADPEHRGGHARADLRVARQRPERAVGDRVARGQQLERSAVAVAARRGEREITIRPSAGTRDRAVLQLRA